MSRIGKQPIEVPKGVKVAINGKQLSVEGPKGTLSRELRAEIDVEMVDNQLVFTRQGDGPKARGFHGMERALVANMVHGVATGFQKILEINGVGYRADVKGDVVNLALGYSHPIDFKLPKGVVGTVMKEGRDLALKLEGIDKELVGITAARIRDLRPPEPYKGKGVRYRGEEVRRKAGKAGKK